MDTARQDDENASRQMFDTRVVGISITFDDGVALPGQKNTGPIYTIKLQTRNRISRKAPSIQEPFQYLQRDQQNHRRQIQPSHRWEDLANRSKDGLRQS